MCRIQTHNKLSTKISLVYLVVFNIILDHWRPGRVGRGGRVGCSAHSKVGITDVLGIKGTHGDLVHWGEVGLHHIDTFHVSLTIGIY